MSAGVYESEEVLAEKYRAGLRTTIHDDMAGSRIWTVEEAYQVALQIEEKLKRSYTLPKLTSSLVPTPKSAPQQLKTIDDKAKNNLLQVW